MGAPEVILGLIEERRGYVVRGEKGRVAEVDAVLASFDVAVADDGSPITDDENPTLETTDAKPAKTPAAKRAVKTKAKAAKAAAAKATGAPPSVKPDFSQSSAGHLVGPDPAPLDDK